MRYADLLEDLQFRDENTGAHSGQSDFTLRAYDGVQEVGHIDYVVYQGAISISMISVPKGKRRNGHATALVRELQRQYPDIEIDWGGMTQQGSALRQSIPKTVIQHKDVQEKMALLRRKQAEAASLEQLANEYYDRDDHSPEEREAFKASMEPWNDLRDEIWDLEQELGKAKETTTLIA